MRRIFSFLIIIAMLLPCCAIGEQEKIIELGPYTFDATGSKRTSSGYDDILDVYFPATDDGREFNSVIYYLSFDVLGITLDDLVTSFGTTDRYVLAAREVDACFGPESNATYVIGYTAEDIWPYLEPNGALFNSVLTSQYNSTLMAGALLVSDEGILIIECFTFGYDLAEAQDFRLDILNRFTYNGEPVVRDEADPDAPQYLRDEDLGNETTFTIGDYSYRTEGYFTTEKPSEDQLYIYYGDTAIYFDYYTFDMFGATRETAPALLGLSDSSDYAIADFFYKLVYVDDPVYSAFFEGLEIESTEMPYMFSGMLIDDVSSTSTWMTGAIIVDENGVLFIEIATYESRNTYDDMDHLRSTVLDELKYGGKPVLGTLIPAAESVFSSHSSHQFTSTIMAPKLKLGESFSFDLSGSVRNEEFSDDSMSDYPTAVSSHIEYDHGILSINFHPYEWYGSSREWLLKTLNPTDPEKALANYILNMVKASFGRFGSGFTTDGPHMYGDYAYIRFTGEYNNYGSSIHISGMIMTAVDGVLVMIYYPNDATAESSSEMLDTLLNNLRYEGNRLDLN